MDKFKILIIVFLLLIGIYYIGVFKSHYFINYDYEYSGCINDNCVDLEVSDSSYKNIVGLYAERSLDEDHGFLLKYDKEQDLKITTKRMNYPIDIIWIGEDNTVQHIEENVIGDVVQGEGKYVLEVNSGWVKNNNISEGESFRTNYDISD